MGTTSLITQEHHSEALAIRPELDVEYTTRQMLARVAIVAQVKEKLMKENVHFGKPPGMNKNAKPVLLKPGAETLLMAFNISPTYEYEDLSDKDETVRYRFKVVGRDASGRIVGQGLGEASSNEEKYRWRGAAKAEYDATDESRRRIKHKKGWQDKPDTKEFQVRTYAPDIANTVLKMASKRALVHLAITVTACSDMFDQDIEELNENLGEMGYTETQDNEPRPAPAKPAAAATGVPMATDELRQKMWAAAKVVQPEQMNGEQWKAACLDHIEKTYGSRDTRALTKVQIEDLIRGFEETAKQPQQPAENLDAEPAGADDEKPKVYFANDNK